MDFILNMENMRFPYFSFSTRRSHRRQFLTWYSCSASKSRQKMGGLLFYLNLQKAKCHFRENPNFPRKTCTALQGDSNKMGYPPFFVEILTLNKNIKSKIVYGDSFECWTKNTETSCIDALIGNLVSTKNMGSLSRNSVEIC